MKTIKTTLLNRHQAEIRSTLWKTLHASGASLLWHPCIIDRVLNELNEPRNIVQIAHWAAENGEPQSAEQMLGHLRARLEDAPFWHGYLRSQITRIVPFSFHGNGELLESAVEAGWESACRATQSYTPVGIAEGGALRPHYFHNYLSLCLRDSIRRIFRLVTSATAIRLDDPDREPAKEDEAISPSNESDPDLAAYLRMAIGKVRENPRTERVFQSHWV